VKIRVEETKGFANKLLFYPHFSVKLVCTTVDMMATFRMDRRFDGKILSSAHPDRCHFDISGDYQFNVTFPILDRNYCGVEGGVIGFMSILFEII